ncbi:MAG TPA: hypothetical protein VMN82_03795, partial [Thermoanaerobaculia bacterium]|nr:hypothetical protein [Thermoanaerobaculia bacterium]
MKGSRFLLAAGFLAALAIRVAYLRHFTTNPDVAAFENTIAVLRGGGDLYRDTPRYNYSPLWAGVLLAVDAAARWLHVSVGAALGAWLLAVDAATALLLSRLAGGGRRGASAALLFFGNPVSIFVSSFHLQFDNFAIFFLLLALARGVRTPAARVGTAIALAASILVKHVTVFFPPLFVRRRGRAGISFLEGAVPYV